MIAVFAVRYQDTKSGSRKDSRVKMPLYFGGSGQIVRPSEVGLSFDKSAVEIIAL
jgi:hypothetical protein